MNEIAEFWKDFKPTPTWFKALMFLVVFLPIVDLIMAIATPGCGCK